jgi:hypothetical protein
VQVSSGRIAVFGLSATAGIINWWLQPVASDYLASGCGRQSRLAAAESFLFEALELVGFGIRWLERFCARLRCPPCSGTDE